MQTVKDWLSATKIDFSIYFSESINIHHIFPSRCVKNGISKDDYNCIINKTPLSGHTNRIVGDAEYENLKIHGDLRLCGTHCLEQADREHCRRSPTLKILQDQGHTEIECVVVDLDETEEKALNVALNKVSGEWDLPKLADLISELDNGIFDITLTGFDAAEIEDLFSKVHDKDVKEDDFDLSAALEKATFVETGDIWTVGRHRLMCGDALNAEDVAKLIAKLKIF